jgi:HTH-type transcriptional regulator / antitoxin HigA
MVTTSQYRPDYAVPPGWILDERLEAQSVSQAEFARRCGRSSKLISEIISGKASIEPQTAIQFEKVLGVHASIWLGIESRFQLFQAREAEIKAAVEAIAWSQMFPVKELVRRSIIPRPESDADTVPKLLMFFGVGSVKAWHAKYGLENVAYRHSPSFKSDESALATWKRLGDLIAGAQECAEYNEGRFKHALKEIRTLTREPIEAALDRTKELCNQSGVALALVKPLPKTSLSGAAWWQSPRKAVIQLSARHKTDDHLWFSFFHEAAHVLLHSKKDVFVDGTNGGVADLEAEADEWASNALVPRAHWAKFVAANLWSQHAVEVFAKSLGIAPGIVVGMLQHAGHLPWTHLNGLKLRFEWKNTDNE